MRGLEGKVASAFLGAFLPCLIAAAVLSPRTASAQPSFRVHIGDTFTADAVRRALEGAARRLRTAECSAVFSSTTLLDQQGRLLQARLTELQTDGADHLAQLAFYDGSGARTCQRDDVLAFTTPGAPHVFVCGPRFLAAWKRSPWRVELVLIHETLHTLGLGENPPTSQAINKVVRNHCDQGSNTAAR
jgi:hypothetical protein